MNMTGRDVSADLSAKFPRSSFPAMSNVRNIKEVKNLFSIKPDRQEAPFSMPSLKKNAAQCTCEGIDFLPLAADTLVGDMR